MTYLALKLVHILSATVLFGTGLGTAYYQWRAWRTGDARVLAKVAAFVVFADFVFTLPAVIVQPLTGLWMMHIAGMDFGATWLWLSLALYALAGACWLPVVWLQLRVRNEARAAAHHGRPLSTRCHAHMRLWFALGWPAFGAVLAVFALMVYRPA